MTNEFDVLNDMDNNFHSAMRKAEFLLDTLSNLVTYHCNKNEFDSPAVAELKNDILEYVVFRLGQLG